MYFCKEIKRQEKEKIGTRVTAGYNLSQGHITGVAHSKQVTEQLWPKTGIPLRAAHFPVRKAQGGSSALFFVMAGAGFLETGA